MTLKTKTFQLCWYGWAAWKRCFLQRWAKTDGAYGRLFRWRLAIGPLDIRRWNGPAK